jgi:hypothetical protein
MKALNFNSFLQISKKSLMPKIIKICWFNKNKMFKMRSIRDMIKLNFLNFKNLIQIFSTKTSNNQLSRKNKFFIKFKIILLHSIAIKFHKILCLFFNKKQMFMKILNNLKNSKKIRK